MPGLATLPRRALVWAALTFLIGVGVANALRHEWICDDAFITFRYVRFFLRGEGLVYNIGERVEGYSNLLWLMELATIQRLAYVLPEHAVGSLSMAYTVATFGLVVALARLDARAGWRDASMLAVVGFLALHRSFAVWATGGLETRQFTFFVLLGVALIRRPPSARWGLLPASVAYALAGLTRPEAPLFLATTTLILATDTKLFRVGKRRALMQLILPALSIFLAHTAFRIAYYGDFVPNTFHAKSEWVPAMGAIYFRALALETGLLVIVPLACIGTALRFRQGDRGLLMGLSPLLPHGLYLLTLGGDHFEWRPIDVWWPFLALSMAPALTALPPLARPLAWVGVGTFGIGFQLYIDAISLPCTNEIETHQMVSREFNPTRAPSLYAFPFAAPFLDRYRADIYFLNSHAAGARREQIAVVTRRFDSILSPLHGLSGVRLPPEIVLAMPPAGVIPYTAGDVTAVELLNDRTIAQHRKSDAWFVDVAHNRTPPPGYLDSRHAYATLGHATTSESEALWDTQCAYRLTTTVFVPIEIAYWLERQTDRLSYQRTREEWLHRALLGRDATCVSYREGLHVVIEGHAMRVVNPLTTWEGADLGPSVSRLRVAHGVRRGFGHFQEAVVRGDSMQSESFAAVDGRWVMLFLAISPGSEARLVCDDITRATQTTRADKWFEFVRFQTPRDASTCRLVVAPLGTHGLWVGTPMLLEPEPRQ